MHKTGAGACVLSIKLSCTKVVHVDQPCAIIPGGAQ